jgi:hypothetical protein
VVNSKVVGWAPGYWFLSKKSFDSKFLVFASEQASAEGSQSEQDVHPAAPPAQRHPDRRIPGKGSATMRNRLQVSNDKLKGLFTLSNMYVKDVSYDSTQHDTCIHTTHFFRTTKFSLLSIRLRKYPIGLLVEVQIMDSHTVEVQIVVSPNA